MGHGRHPSLNGLPGPGGYEFRGMSTASGHHGNPQALPKLDTQSLHIDAGASLRTAPPYGTFGSAFEMDNMFFGPGSTINPAQLHFTDSPSSLAFDTPTSPFAQCFSSMPSAHATMDDDGNFEWMNGFENQMSFANANDQAIAGSSPSAISTGSHSGVSEVMLDGSNNPAQTSAMWQNSMMSQAPMIPPYSMDLSGSIFPDLLAPGPLSPKSLQSQLGGSENYFATPPTLLHQQSMSEVHGLPNQFFPSPMVPSSDTPSNSAASVSSSNRQSSVTSISTDTITDATRQALIINLSQPSVFGHNHRKYSQPTVSSPLSPAFSGKQNNSSNVSLPSTYDLQRYISAYIQYFHPHFPFLHVPTLSFDSPDYTSIIGTSTGHTGLGSSNVVGGGGCLILAMAAIGALYEFDTAASKDLFEKGKKMIQLYLEERRKAALSCANTRAESSASNTPLWLVQAMLLNVIYGHNCGDKTSADIASTHCAALVSLARAAELAQPYQYRSVSRNGFTQKMDGQFGNEDIRMSDDSWNSDPSQKISEDQSEWYNWKVAEGRKRTLFAVFVLSSMLVSAYNHAPALTNSDIRLDLPCDEDLWAADTCENWYALGGAAVAEQKATSFAIALSSLLTASQRQPKHRNHLSQPFSMDQNASEFPDPGFQPSTYGCVILINALHNYIWETRQRHLGRVWTTQETEAMHAHIEPALKAWQAAWSSHPQHSLERPNPFGMGPLSADSIPLLDLAYVRLFVNLGRSKEAFWQRDFDGMSDELARGAEIVQHADHSVLNSPEITDSAGPSTISNSPTSNPTYNNLDHSSSSISQDNMQPSRQSSKRERHLRRAAFYAANSLSMSDKLGVTFADFSSRELPIQSAMCAFDCTQVLAEWVATIQERVGRYLGILGKDEVDFGQVPGIMLLEDEDCRLLEKIDEVLNSAGNKMNIDNGGMSAMAAMTSSNGTPNLKDCGYGSQILMVTAHMLDKAAVWPGEPRDEAFLTMFTKSSSDSSNGPIARNPGSTHERKGRKIS